jgi:stringent starvation protein B
LTISGLGLGEKIPIRNAPAERTARDLARASARRRALIRRFRVFGFGASVRLGTEVAHFEHTRFIPARRCCTGGRSSLAFGGGQGYEKGPMASKLPKKKDVALALLEQASVFIHLDPRRDGVQVPVGFKKQAQLVLQIGLNMVVKIPDLEVDDEGISCTLSFNRRPHYCHMPWGAIYALVDESGRGMVWPDDVPPEVVAQQREGAKKSTATPRPRLRAVDAPGAEARVPEARGAEARASEARLSDVSSPHAAEETIADTEVTPPKLPEAAPARERAEAARTKSGKIAAQTDGAGQTSSASKSTRPPYLRVVK